jgi:hypothetical protein
MTISIGQAPDIFCQGSYLVIRGGTATTVSNDDQSTHRHFLELTCGLLL